MPENTTELYVVAKAFPHPTRRFKIGDPIFEALVAGIEGLDWEDMKKRRVVVSPETKAGEKAIEQAETATEETEEHRGAARKRNR